MNIVRQYATIDRNAAALFLDRDGVINLDGGYLDDPARVELIPGAVAAINRFNMAQVPVIIVTNQSGVGRGLFCQNAMIAVQIEVETQVAAGGGRIDAVMISLVAPDDTTALINWRKPNPGMFLAAKDLFGVDLASSWIVGDKIQDMMAGERAGLRAGTLVGDNAFVSSAPTLGNFELYRAASLASATPAIFAAMQIDG